MRFVCHDRTFLRGLSNRGLDVSERRHGGVPHASVDLRIVARRDDSQVGEPGQVKWSRPFWSARSDDAATFGCGLGRDGYPGSYVDWVEKTGMEAPKVHA